MLGLQFVVAFYLCGYASGGRTLFMLCLQLMRLEVLDKFDKECVYAV